MPAYEPARTEWPVRPIHWDRTTSPFARSLPGNDSSERAAAEAAGPSPEQTILGVLQRWVRYASAQYRDWTVRPRCGHFFGGSYWYMSETVSTSFALAVASSFGEWDARAAGIQRDMVQDQVVRGIRYACFTHDTGPADCAREESSLHYVSGRKWGGNGENFFMASQNGRSVSFLAHAALLMWEKLDRETRMLVQNVASSYADRWSSEEPHTGTYYDTQCEENAWTAAGISAAMLMFPEHPHQESWRDGFRRWARNVMTTPADRARAPHGLIDAMPGDSIQTVTFHPDFTAENHGFVHPAYMCAGINLRGLSLTLSALTGVPPEAAATLNNVELYRRAVRYWTQCDGTIIPVQGQDWWYNRQHDALVTHALMSVVHGLPEAALFERDAVQTIAAIQASNSRGCLLEENGETCVINALHGQYANQLEHGTAAELCLAFLIHRFGGPGAVPRERSGLEAELRGVRSYPFGGVVIHRTPRSFASFSFRNHVMAFVAPSTGMWTVTPHYLSYLGRMTASASATVTDAGRGALTASAERLAEQAGGQAEAVIGDADDVSLRRKQDGFVLTAVVPRCDGLIEQRVLFASLPDGKAVYAERVRARTDLFLHELATGLIGVRNESYRALAGLAPGHKSLFHPGGVLSFEGFYGREPDRAEMLPSSEWVNLDNKMGYLLHGTSGVRYLNRHIYEKWRGVEDQLTLNLRQGIALRAGDSIPIFAVTTAVNQEATETARARSRSRLLDAGAQAIALQEDGVLVYARFRGEDPVRAPVEGDATVPLYPGNQEIDSMEWRWLPQIPGPGADYVTPVAALKLPQEGSRPRGLDVRCVVSGTAVVLHNRGNREIRLSMVIGRGTPEDVMLPAGGLIARDTAPG